MEFSKILQYETYYDEFQPYFEEKNIQTHYMDTDIFVLKVNTNDIVKDFKVSRICLIVAIYIKKINYSVMETLLKI